MSVEFNEINISEYRYKDSAQTGIIGWIIRRGIASSKKQAQMILIGILFLTLFVIVLSFIFSSGEDDLPPETYYPAEL